MNRKALTLGLVAALAIAAGGTWFIQQRRAALIETQRQEQAVPVAAPAVTVTRVKTSDFVKTVSVSGSLVPREEILVSPEIEGFRVLELFADEGDRVTKGQVLARLVSDQLDAQMAQNVANIARSNAAIAQAKSQITQAEAQYKEAKNQLERAEPLKKSGWMSGSTYDQRESAARTAEAAVVAARDGLVAADAQKAQVEAQGRELQWRRDNTAVTAPADGIVSRRNARIGGLASAIGEPMFRIVAKGEVELDAEVVETELASVKEGQKAHVSVPGATEIEGTVRLVSPEVDKATRLGRVRIFLGSNRALRVGAYAFGEIETARSRGLAVPAAAVTFTPGEAVAQVINGDKVERRVLKVGLISGDLVEVKSGLANGDLVVTRAGTFLREGDIVRPILPDTALSEAIN